MANLKEIVKNKSAKRFLFIILICVLYLASNKYFNKKDINLNGVINKAIVERCQYFNYKENAKSSKRVKFYKINIKYYFEGEEYRKTLSLSESEYSKKIYYKLSPNDQLKIKHSRSNPNIINILKNY